MEGHSLGTRYKVHYICAEAKRNKTTPVLTFDQPLWWKALSIISSETEFQIEEQFWISQRAQMVVDCRQDRNTDFQKEIYFLGSNS